MNSMFATAAFSRFDLGKHALAGGLGLPRLRLAQASAFALEDYIQKIEGISDTGVKDALRAKYDECQTKEGTAQITCYAGLAAEVYAAIQSEGKPVAAPPVLPPRAPAASSFPIVPVAIAVLAAGGLIYFLATKGKK